MRAWRLHVAKIAEYRLGMVEPKNEREWRFIGYYCDEVLSALGEGKRMSAELRREAGKAAVRRAGYIEKKEYLVAKRADEMLELPRIQRGVLALMEEAGLHLKDGFAAMAEILHSPLRTTVVEDGKATTSGVSPKDKLDTVRLMTDLTVGAAPTKVDQRSVNVDVHSTFDAERFSQPAPIVTARVER